MQVTAFVENNTLIIPNLNRTHLKPLADKVGFVSFELPTLENFNLDDLKPTTAKPKKSIQELAGGLAHKTTVVATVEEMNESIGQVYTNKIN